MDQQAIDAAVDIVHSLPKGGPVQTTYEEKLWLYSLYKQSTEGDIAIARPGLLDMLGRAKWDSWHKQKGKEKDAAKRQYVDALLNEILRKYGRTAISRNLIAELTAYDPASSLLSSHHSRAHARARSRSASSAGSSSSGASFHSSQASPPRSPSPPPPGLHPASSIPGQEQPWPLPEPDMPIPDIAPEIIPPSALNASHKSLLSLANAAGMSNPYGMRDMGREEAEAAHGSSGGTNQAFRPDLTGTGHVASRTHSLIEGRTGRAGYEGGHSAAGGYTHGRASPSVHSLRSGTGRVAGQAASALGFAPLNGTVPAPAHIHSQAQAQTQSSLHPAQHNRYLTPDPSLPPGVIARDYTPNPSASPYNPLRPGTPSTYTVPPINVPATLQQIQTSLTALHERLSTLERAQGLILRREERKRGSWFGGILGGRREEEELDEAEEEAERERRGLMPGQGVRERNGRVKVKARSRLALVWWLIRMIRRLMVDITVGTVLAVAVVLVMRGWKGDYLRRLKTRVRGLIRNE